MKVENMTGRSGKPVANQFILTGNIGHTVSIREFQSYRSIIVRQTTRPDGLVITRLDKTFWDYSKTTGKYRNQFLGESKAETQKKIDSGEYILTDLN